MDAARYQTLIAADSNLEARVRQLEAQGVPRDPNYAPPGIDPDLMYTDQYVNRAYHTRPTFGGRFLFFLVCIPSFMAMAGVLVWLVFIKRWYTTA